MTSFVAMIFWIFLFYPSMLPVPDQFAISIDGFDAMQRNVMAYPLGIDKLKKEVMFRFKIEGLEWDANQMIFKVVKVFNLEIALRIVWIPANLIE